MPAKGCSRNEHGASLVADGQTIGCNGETAGILALGELEAGAGAALSVLLTLDGARIAG
jgi:hypothetical protein